MSERTAELTRLNAELAEAKAEADEANFSKTRFIAAAIRFVADHGVKFLPVYRFDMHTGAWRHRTAPASEVPFGIDAALEAAARPAAAVPGGDGITGGGPVTIRSGLQDSAIGVGNIVEESAGGIIVWPKLTYKLPNAAPDAQ